MDAMRITLMSGAGNRFAMIDGFEETLPANLDEIARAAAAEIQPRPDGVIVAARPTSGGDCAMIIHNADGSRPETCGNGLRCVAKLVVDRGHVRSPTFVIETDAGPCECTVELEDGRVARASVHMGNPRVIARDVDIEIDVPAPATVVRGTLVDVGNPHCVLFVDDERKAEVTTQGARIEKHAALFPRGTNVEFLALRSGRFHLRVWERGAGETQACGTGACAAALVAVERGLARFPVRLELPGGALEVDSDGQGGVILMGPVEEHGTIEWNPAGAARARRA
jgi:diaminopimelate epimerase